MTNSRKLIHSDDFYKYIENEQNLEELVVKCDIVTEPNKSNDYLLSIYIEQATHTNQLMLFGNGHELT